MSHSGDLHRIAFSAVHHAVWYPKSLVANGITAIPKLCGDALICYILKHPHSFTVLDTPECIASKLEVLAHLVDAEAAHTLYVYPVLSIRDQIIQR